MIPHHENDPDLIVAMSEKAKRILETKKRMNLTYKQEEELCYIIGEWYMDWKVKITDGQHRLGYAKEELKMRICKE